MSWQEYIDKSLVGTGNLDKALICDVGGQTIWASSPNFALTPAEMSTIATSFTDKSSPKTILTNGVKIGQDKFMTVEASDDTLIAKKGKEGLVAYKTTQAILIAHHNEEVQTPTAINSVTELGLYLKNLGY